MEPSALSFIVWAVLAAQAPSSGTRTPITLTAEGSPNHSLTLPNAAITQPALIAVTSDYRFVGREVAFDDVYVERVEPHGFWISTPDAADQTFVVPAEGPLVVARPGDHVSIHGEVRQLSDALRRMLFLGYAWDEHIYVYAFTVRPTGLWRDRSGGSTRESP